MELWGRVDLGCPFSTLLLFLLMLSPDSSLPEVSPPAGETTVFIVGTKLQPLKKYYSMIK